MHFVTTATAMTPLVYLHLVYVETWFCLQISQFEFCALKNLHCGQVMKKKLEEKFSKKNSGRTMSENLRGGQRPENWLGRIMSENIQGGQCPGTKGEQCPEG